MYNPKEIQHVGKHDFSRDAIFGSNRTFSVGVFKWELKGNGKSMKKGKALVRVTGFVDSKDMVFRFAEHVVKMLDAETWDGKKSVKAWPFWK